MNSTFTVTTMASQSTRRTDRPGFSGFLNRCQRFRASEFAKVLCSEKQIPHHDSQPCYHSFLLPWHFTFAAAFGCFLAHSASVRFGLDLSLSFSLSLSLSLHCHRIVGVGLPAGPMASRLKQMGYTKTVLFECTDRVSGKSLTLYIDNTLEFIQQNDKTK